MQTVNSLGQRRAEPRGMSEGGLELELELLCTAANYKREGQVTILVPAFASPRNCRHAEGEMTTCIWRE